jgi:hypothetical protein
VIACRWWAHWNRRQCVPSGHALWPVKYFASAPGEREGARATIPEPNVFLEPGRSSGVAASPSTGVSSIRIWFDVLLITCNRLVDGWGALDQKNRRLKRSCLCRACSRSTVYSRSRRTLSISGSLRK